MNNWTKCIQQRLKWKEVAEKAKTFKNQLYRLDDDDDDGNNNNNNNNNKNKYNNNYV
jgi:hypothetical protein